MRKVVTSNNTRFILIMCLLSGFTLLAVIMKKIWVLILPMIILRMFNGFAPEKDPQMKAYKKSMDLSMLNPFTQVMSLFQLVGHLLIKIRYRGQLPDYDTYQNKVSYILPFEGVWNAANGDPTEEKSHSWEILTQRYAYDFVIMDETKKSFENNGNSLTDYYSYEKNILSPADGIVVKTQNSISDYKNVGDGSIDWKVRDFRGNFVIIKHAENEYSFLAHLKKGSVIVKKGDAVKRGQIIGKCGNSGHSTEPHLHFHLQDRANMWIAMSLPIIFFQIRFTANGRDEVLKEAVLQKDDFVENHATNFN
jgi:hypothetical protein